jgi:sigma-B regulation protein RsbU (phosphoserine phosphatase)
MSDFPSLLRLPCLAVVFVALLSACPGQAQSFDASGPTGIDRPTPLGGTWLMKPGDDLAYAQPGYDDSAWTRMDLSHDLHDYVRGPRPEVVWYRLHLRTSPTQTDLALATHEFGRAWEIYANGSPILRLGRVAPYTPYLAWTRLVGPLPEQAVRSGTVVLAVRLAIPEQEWVQPQPGLDSTSLQLGNRDVLQTDIWLYLFESQLTYLGALLGFAISVAALALYTAQQRRIEYLWMLVAGLTWMLGVFIILYAFLRPTPQWVGTFLNCSYVIRNLAFALMYFGFLKYKPSKWVRISMVVVFTAAALMMVGQSFDWIPNVFAPIADLLMAAVAFGFVAWIAFRDARRGNREAYTLLFSSLMGVGLYMDGVFNILVQFSGTLRFANEIESSWIYRGFTFGPVNVNGYQTCNLLFWPSLAVVLILRSNRISLAQSALESEIEAAGQVQEVILPKPGGEYPGISRAFGLPAGATGGRGLLPGCPGQRRRLAADRR